MKNSTDTTVLLAAPATARWKSQSASARSRVPSSIATTRRLRNVIWTQNTSGFLETSLRVKTAGVVSGKAEEHQEVSTQLNILRKKHDQSAEFTFRQQKTLDTLKFELEHLGQIENTGSEGLSTLQERVENTENRINEIKSEQDDSAMSTLVYEHMLERMKQTKLYLELKAQDLQQSLRSKRQVLKEELERHRRAREVKSQARVALDKLKKTVDRDRLDKEEHLASLEEDRKLKEENASKREERQRRQQEITEKAANEDRDVEERRIKDSLFMHRLWARFLESKLQKEMQKSNSVEEAFQKIRVTTGMDEINEIVERFLTREQTYSQLVSNVTNSERRLASIRADNLDLEDKIKKLKIAGAEAQHEKEKNEIDRLVKENAVNDLKIGRTKLVYERVQRWINRMSNRLKAAEVGSDATILSRAPSQEGTPTLQEDFLGLKSLASKLIVFVASAKQDLIGRLDQLKSEKLKELADEASTILTQRRRVMDSPAKSKHETHDPEEDERMQTELEEGRRSLKRKFHEFLDAEKKRQEKKKKKNEKP
mmetsp:Transcript_7391/g.13773  ORF Transcript_7391/g.13773 Transcript_7391/m.13773 type:complete len:541 (-) Transcript_7391:96-1718(-)